VGTEIADELNLSFGTCQAILTQDLGMRRVSAKLVMHHDNAPCHAALSVREFLAKYRILVVLHPPYSPDLAPCDFFLFPRLKSTLKGKRFQDVAEIQLNTTLQLQAIPKQAYQICTEMWKDRWNRCIQSGGSYFEGDNFE
jgi:transposase